GFGRDPGAAHREAAGDAVGTAASVRVDLVVDAELPRAQLPEALDEGHHLLAVRRADVEDLVDEGLLALGLRPGEVAHQDDVVVGGAPAAGQRPGEGRRAHVVREEEHLLLLDEIDRVANARRRLVAVVERDHRHHPAVDAATRSSWWATSPGRSPSARSPSST